jgi:hypothetical protein
MIFFFIYNIYSLIRTKSYNLQAKNESSSEPDA